MVLSDTLKTSSQGGAFQVRSSSGPLGSVSKVQDIFSEMDFLATEYNSKSLQCFGYHLITLTNSLKGAWCWARF